VIGAYPGELNQVWTNLIDNALDAMDGAGTLRLATRAEQDAIVVEVGDTGPGMAPQVASRAFDAFYTTKDAGRGTGLGLDIARRTVVERHGGIITIDSRPGKTVLRVRLPVRPPGLPGAVSRSGQVDHYDLRSRRRLRLLPLDRHRTSGQRPTQETRLSGVTLAPGLAVLQYLRSDKDGRVDKRGEVQRVTGSRVDERHPERAFDLNRRGVSTLDQTVDPNLTDAPPQACEQRRNELVGHRATPLHALKGGRQAERLGLADLDQEVTAPSHLVQHDTSDVMVIRLESDDLADPHLDEVDIHGPDHSGLLSPCIFYYHAIFNIRPTCSQSDSAAAEFGDFGLGGRRRRGRGGSTLSRLRSSGRARRGQRPSDHCVVGRGRSVTMRPWGKTTHLVTDPVTGDGSGDGDGGDVGDGVAVMAS
jgi:hypothetical protein